MKYWRGQIEYETSGRTWRKTQSPHYSHIPSENESGAKFYLKQRAPKSARNIRVLYLEEIKG